MNSQEGIFENSNAVYSNTNIEWTPDHERIFVEWGDKAMCYRWLHSRSNMMYNTLNTWYTIPVIIISTLTGTANFAQERVPFQYQSMFVMIIGCFNILAGIITTIQQFLKITQLNEAHRVSSIAWDKFYRNIKTQLANHPDERMNVTQMLKLCKEEFDRLMETSPVIPEKIIQNFTEVREQLEQVYRKSRVLDKPQDYILDQDHHNHPANQSINFDWQFMAELMALEKIEKHFKTKPYSLEGKKPNLQ